MPGHQKVPPSAKIMNRMFVKLHYNCLFYKVLIFWDAKIKKKFPTRLLGT